MGFRKISCSVVMSLALAGTVSASDENLNTLDRAKSLYASAAYDEALVVLDHLSTTAPAIDDPMSVGAYRVYCLLALDREDEARTLIDRLLHQSPLFVPSANEASPHIQTIFRDVRHAALPKIARERYADAKAAFDRKDPLAARRFDDLLTLLDDPDLHDWAAAADLRAVASAFRDLAQAVVTTPVSPIAEPKRAEWLSQPPLEAPEVTYTAADPDVTPPVALEQRAPQWRPSIHESGKDYTGVLRLLIDRSGSVTSATMQSGTLPVYDQALVRAARDWKFQPALKQGRPVRYLKIIEIRLASSNP